MDWATLAGYWPFVLGLMVTGVVSGVAAGLLGIGGGAIIVPALSNALLLLGYDADVVQHVAVGTSLAIIIPTGIMSARAHYKRGRWISRCSSYGRRSSWPARSSAG